MTATAPMGTPGAAAPGKPPAGRRAVMGLVSRPWTLIVVALLVLFAVWVVSTRSQAHEVKAAFPSAVSVVPGLDVQANGVDVGKITSVDYSDGQAIVGIGIDDEDLWPLRRGTTATLRFGTTAGNGTRRIDLVPGPRTAPEIAEGGIISAELTRSPVEFDDVFRMMDRETRDHMQSMTARTAETLEGRATKLNDGIRASAPALEGAGGLLGDLAADEQALKGVIANTHRATRALASREGQISSLVTVAAQTFQEFANNTRSVGESIEEAPAALDDARTTLARLDGSVTKLKATVRDAAPGAALLAGLAADARPAVSELASTAPRLTRLLRTGRRAAPDITRLVDEGTPFARRLTPILSDLSPMLACLRPYAPELAGTMSNWGSYAQNYDGYGHYARMNVMGGPASLASTPEMKTKDFTAATGLKYALPRPPGLNGGQPWFIPECGVGPESLDPSKDPEDRK